MSKELDALVANKTWTLTSLPPGKCTIGSRWIYKLKLHPNGSIDRYKAHLLEKGYNQIKGVDYFDSFFPVTKAVTPGLQTAEIVIWPQADILLTGSSSSALNSVKDHLDHLFSIKDLGPANYFLRLELACSSHGLQVTQCNYLQDILVDISLLDARPASTPFPPGLKLVLDDGSLLPDPNHFKRLVGRLLYLGCTRPDISFAVQ
ncbi:UNVERIFIED_CONTAM: Retrovirus-related Pol polyprotein from transposon RE1 [Sesamum indicum]